MTATVPVIGGLALGLAAGLTAVLIPPDLLAAGVDASGIAALLPVAEPPLGTTARAVLALSGGLLAAVIGWSALYLLIGPEGLVATLQQRRARDTDVPVVRRADAHPDAPPRRPFCAGALPTLDEAPAVERPLPADLDTPLAAYDPDSIPEQPCEPVRAVEPLAARVALSPGERIDTFDLTPSPAIAESIASDAPPSLAALLDRLEKVSGGRHVVRPPAGSSLETTLGSLRRLATHNG